MGDAERARPLVELRRLAAVTLAIAAAAIALGACASQTPPPQPTGDPATLGHSVWCGTNPPSGYCMYD